MRREPKRTAVVAEIAASLLAATLAVVPVGAQQVTGVLGSPSATTTIDGKQLPPPPAKFGGVIKQDPKTRSLTGQRASSRPTRERNEP